MANENPNTLLTADEQAKLAEGRKATLDLVKRVGQPGGPQMTLASLVADARERNEPTVTMILQRPVTLTFKNHQQVKIPAGIQEVPVMFGAEPFADHWYLRAHGAKPYDKQTPVEKVVTTRSIEDIKKELARAEEDEAIKARRDAEDAKLEADRRAEVDAKAETASGPAMVEIGGVQVPAAELDLAAFKASGMTTDAWNALTDQQRAARVQDIVNARRGAFKKK